MNTAQQILALPADQQNDAFNDACLGAVEAFASDDESAGYAKFEDGSIIRCYSDGRMYEISAEEFEAELAAWRAV